MISQTLQKIFMLFTANFPMNSISISWSKQKRKNYWLYFINISHNNTFSRNTICLIYIYCLLFSLFLTFVTLVIANFVFTLFFASSHNHHYISYNSHFIPHNWDFLVIAAVYLTMWLYNRTTATFLDLRLFLVIANLFLIVFPFSISHTSPLISWLSV